jgi:hypothetical protein
VSTHITTRSTTTTIPGWVIRTGSPNVMCYSTARVGHPAGAAVPCFFSSGPYGDSAMTQTARLALPAAAGRSRSYRLSGWLGEWKTDPGYVKVSLVFLGRSGRPDFPPATLRTVSRASRNGRTRLLRRVAAGPVPRGTASIRVVVRFLHSSTRTTRRSSTTPTSAATGPGARRTWWTPGNWRRT